jgi:hypothetical protein
MIKTTTPGDLILYAYNESGLRDSDRIQRSIDGDPVVQDEFAEIVQAMNALDSIQVEPSKKIVEKIIAFAKTGKA